jgi:hypothetical protein
MLGLLLTWAGLTYIGWQGVKMGWWKPCLRLGFELSLQMEPELTPRWVALPPPVMGSIGNLGVRIMQFLLITLSLLMGLARRDCDARWSLGWLDYVRPSEINLQSVCMPT